MPRRSWPENVRTQILIKSNRICAMCFHFKSDWSVKMRGQIAHVDRDPSNAEMENGAYLCKDHHDEYDMVSTQSVRFDPAELKQARENLYEFLQSGGAPSRENRMARRPKQPKRPAVSLAVCDRRLPIYKATIEFIRYVVRDLKPGYPEIFKFGHDTEEALFLFDERIDQYLNELSSRAIRLHAVVMMREAAVTRHHEVGSFQSLLEEESSIAAWFTEQYHASRRTFAPFLRLE